MGCSPAETLEEVESAATGGGDVLPLDDPYSGSGSSSSSSTPVASPTYLIDWEDSTSPDPSPYTFSDTSKIEFSGTGLIQLKNANQTDDNESDFSGVGGSISYYTPAPSPDVTPTPQAGIIISSPTAGGSAAYTSRLIDSTSATADWTSFYWVTEYPAGKPLPDLKIAESGYPSGNINSSSSGLNNEILYHFDESSFGSPGTDSTGNSRTWSAASAPSAAAGIINGSLLFASDQTVVANANLTALGSVAQYSVSLWIKRSTTSSISFPEILVNNISGNAGFSISANTVGTSGNAFNLCVTLANGPVAACAEVATALGDLWNHLLFTVATNGDLTIYINGVSAATDTGNAAQSFGSSNIIFGSTAVFGVSTSWRGSLDEFAVFSTVATADQALSIYKRAATNVSMKYQTCTSSISCGALSTAYTEATRSAESGTPVETISETAIRYVKYEATLSSVHDGVTPKIVSVGFGPDRYAADGPTATCNVALDFKRLISMSHTLGGSNAGEVRYQISLNQTTWLYYNSTANQFVPVDDTLPTPNLLQSNTVTQLNTVFTPLSTMAPDGGSIYFRAVLVSSGSQAVELDQTAVRYIAP